MGSLWEGWGWRWGAGARERQRSCGWVGQGSRQEEAEVGPWQPRIWPLAAPHVARGALPGWRGVAGAPCNRVACRPLPRSPVGAKFARRAQQFPGLINGCTIDWFLPWPEEALTSGALLRGATPVACRRAACVAARRDDGSGGGDA